MRLSAEAICHLVYNHSQASSTSDADATDLTVKKEKAESST